LCKYKKKVQFKTSFWTKKINKNRHFFITYLKLKSYKSNIFSKNHDTTREIPSKETYTVCQTISRKGKPIESCVFKGDDLESTRHFGLFEDKKFNRNYFVI